MTKSISLNADEATALAVAFSNYSLALKAFDEGRHAMVNDSVVVSGLALIAIQRIVGLELAKTGLVERLIADIRRDAIGLED